MESSLELRHALEPWNVLAEESVSGSTVRSVDSSLERIQVKVSGLTSEARYAVACNGRRVPIQSVGEVGVAVAGVRFRARKLSSTLHPTVPCACSAGLRPYRLLAESLNLPVHLPRDAVRWPFVHGPSRPTVQRPKAGVASAFKSHRHCAHAHGCTRGRNQPDLPLDFGPADAAACTRGTQVEIPGGRSVTVDLHQTQLPLRQCIQRSICRRCDSTSTLDASDGVSRQRSVPKNCNAAGDAPSAASARTASPTTSTAIRRAQTGPGRSMSFHF
jgi:hypothetical protein